VWGSVCCTQRQAIVVSLKRGVLRSLHNQNLQNLTNTVQTHSEITESEEQRLLHTAPLQEERGLQIIMNDCDQRSLKCLMTSNQRRATVEVIAMFNHKI